MNKIIFFLLAAIFILQTHPAWAIKDCSPRAQYIKDQNQGILTAAHDLSDKQTTAGIGGTEYTDDDGIFHSAKGSMGAVNDLFDECSGGLLTTLQSQWSQIQGLSGILSKTFVLNALKSALNKGLEKACSIAKDNAQQLVDLALQNTTEELKAKKILSYVDDINAARRKIPNNSTGKLDQLSRILSPGNRRYIDQMFEGAILK